MHTIIQSVESDVPEVNSMICQLPCDAHFKAAGNRSKSVVLGPFIDI